MAAACGREIFNRREIFPPETPWATSRPTRPRPGPWDKIYRPPPVFGFIFVFALFFASAGIILRINSANSGTVKAVSPCWGL